MNKAIEAHDRARDEYSLHARMAWFSEKWSDKTDHRKAATFHADLLLLIQAIHRDAMRETHAALTTALAALPPPTIMVHK